MTLCPSLPYPGHSTLLEVKQNFKKINNNNKNTSKELKIDNSAGIMHSFYFIQSIVGARGL